MGGIVQPMRDPEEFLRHPKKLAEQPKTWLFEPEPEPIPPPDPLPTIETELMTEAGEAEVKKTRRRRGRGQTIVTGDLTPTTSKRTLLG